MINLSLIPNRNGNYPSVKAINTTTGTSTDGTQITYEMWSDIWGFFQALTESGSITPSGDIETYDSSQLLQAIQHISGAPGEIVPYVGNSLIGPGADGRRLLECSGQAVAISLYQDLSDATWVGTSYNHMADAFYRTSDSAGTIRANDGVYLVLPDIRGRFLKGIPPVGFHLPGEEEDETVKAHSHQVSDQAEAKNLFTKPSTITVEPSGLNDVAQFVPATTGDETNLVAASFGMSNSGPKNVPDNIVCVWCVRY